MAAGAASGALRGRGDRAAGPVGDGQGRIAARARRRITRACCWGFWSTATPPGCSRAASWSGRPTIRWRSASSPPTIIPTTTPSPRSGGAFLRISRGCSSQVLVLAREAGLLKLGTVALDGTKVHANASRHSALSYEHASKIEAQLRAEVEELMALAEAADQADVPDGMSVPRRAGPARGALGPHRRGQGDDRGAGQGALRARAGRASGEAARRARRRRSTTGRKPGGRPPQPPTAGPGPSDQVNLTDPDSRIMPVAGRRLRAGLQRPGRGGERQPAGGHHRCGPGRQRQAADRADAGQARRASRGAGQARDPAGGQRLFQRGQRRGLRRGRDRAADRAGTRAPSSRLARALRRTTAGARGPDAARRRWRIDWQRPKAGKPTPCASRPRSRCSASSNRSWASDNSHLRGLEKVKGEWNLVTLAWNMKRMFALQYA